MYKLYSIVAAALALAGCASAPADSAASAAQSAQGDATAEPPPTPLQTLNITDFKDRTRCEDVKRLGTRIVVAQRCRPIDEEALAEQLNQVRRDQETLDRLARDRENQRRGGL